MQHEIVKGLGAMFGLDTFCFELYVALSEDCGTHPITVRTSSVTFGPIVTTLRGRNPGGVPGQ